MTKNPNEYLSEIGKRIKAYRVHARLTQQQLEEKSGVSQRSISRLEQGESVQLETFVKILAALGLGENISSLIPDQTKRPSYYLKSTPKEAQRVRKTSESKSAFKWGDEK